MRWGAFAASSGDFVCVLLTWPAGGSRGAFMGYNVDRESGEFAVADMRKAIRAIGQTERVRGVHIIAHSRGTDVLALAFQQLSESPMFRAVRAGYRLRRRRDENI
jgi:esterase/lipase superfamily enzyme